MFRLVVDLDWLFWGGGGIALGYLVGRLRRSKK